MTTQAIIDRIKRIKLLASDVDGVMTDGRLYYTEDGEHMKVFHVQDGHAIKTIQRAGIPFAIISGRKCAAVDRRCRDLGIEHCYTGVGDKVEVCEKICAELGIGLDEVAYVGDDHPDIPLMQASGFAVAVRNARPAVAKAADWISPSDGGKGVIADLVELMTGLLSDEQ